MCLCLSFLTAKLTPVPHVVMFPSIPRCIPPVFPPLYPHPQLQAPTVKGFDFAKLHLGQHNKDDVMVIQEAAPPGPGSGALPVPSKDGLSPSENGELPAPAAKTSAPSTKASRSSRRHERWIQLRSDVLSRKRLLFGSSLLMLSIHANAKLFD